ncbi:hypothetical protein [Canibacter zhuwentaonis]|uniref:hypothetical protein n=1 Tax=Canibacter zhuwentaonis TaxID=2837491 RepID=UPI002027EA91|nr:hypothetical protein [Canibacter zhuwentaonis]
MQSNRLDLADLFGGFSQAAQKSSAVICSRAGCTAPAQWALLWVNPKIHTGNRRKIWLCCEAHLAYLSDFLTARQFLKQTLPIAKLPPRGRA